MAQVTVLSSSAEVSDVLSTSLFVLGPKAGNKLLDTYDGISALMVTRVEGALDRTEVVAIDWPGKTFIRALEPPPRNKLEER
jgi:thiamine biosynthesis lipoprotein ApbE